MSIFTQTSWKGDHFPHRRHRLSRQFSGAGARPKPGTCRVRSEQPAGGQAADSFGGAFDRWRRDRCRRPIAIGLRSTNTRLMWVNHRKAEPYGFREAEPVGPNVSNRQNCHLYSILQTKVPPMLHAARAYKQPYSQDEFNDEGRAARRDGVT
eukprot:scaffold33198_cov54-Phaeocystis_antarctica.AAC.2